MVLLAVRGAGLAENECFDVYSMVYDSKTRGNNGLGNWLGKFKIIQQIVDDYWQDTFIGENVDNGEICLVMAHEVCGTGGGIAYEVFPLPSLTVKKESYESLIDKFNEIGCTSFRMSPEELKEIL